MAPSKIRPDTQWKEKATGKIVTIVALKENPLMEGEGVLVRFKSGVKWHTTTEHLRKTYEPVILN